MKLNVWFRCPEGEKATVFLSRDSFLLPRERKGSGALVKTDFRCRVRAKAAVSLV
jgi:hypothetical protein